VSANCSPRSRIRSLRFQRNRATAQVRRGVGGCELRRVGQQVDGLGQWLELADESNGDRDLEPWRDLSLLSEGRIDYEVTVRVKDGGFTTKKIVKQGPTNLIFTTTKTRVHAENETRILSLATDDSREQTARVLREPPGVRDAHPVLGIGEPPLPPEQQRNRATAQVRGGATACAGAAHPRRHGR
jgi:hypothetical protein